MRPVLFLDVSTAARAVVAVPEAQRAALCTRLLRAADRADLYVQRTGALHPRWGNGTLLAAARGWPIDAERGFDDAEYRRCFTLVLQALDRRGRAAMCKPA